MNVNDQVVINYIKKKGDLVDLNSWSEYSGAYVDEYGSFKNHMHRCRPVEGDLKIVETSQAEFVGTFNEDEQKVIMELHGVQCKCGEFDNLGYVLYTTFSDMLLNILQEQGGVTVDVNVRGR